MPDAVKIDLTNTPEKFHVMAGEILPHLTEFLKELCRLEDEFFVQSKRLHQKGRVIIFQDGIKEEITQYDVLKTKFKGLYRQLIDPHCTLNLLNERRDCLHGESYPSDFNCLHTGCTVVFTMKSANKAVIDLLPDDGSIPYDMTDPDVRYIAEDFIAKPPYFYKYLEMYRFTMKHSEDEWRIDMVHHKGCYDAHWSRDYYF